MAVRLLVVEDEFFIAQEIADAVTLAGFAVVGPFARVAEALAQRGIPFVVVTGFSPDQLPGAMAV